MSTVQFFENAVAPRTQIQANVMPHQITFLDQSDGARVTVNHEDFVPFIHSLVSSCNVKTDSVVTEFVSNGLWLHDGERKECMKFKFGQVEDLLKMVQTVQSGNNQIIVGNGAYDDDTVTVTAICEGLLFHDDRDQTRVLVLEDNISKLVEVIEGALDDVELVEEDYELMVTLDEGDLVLQGLRGTIFVASSSLPELKYFLVNGVPMHVATSPTTQIKVTNGSMFSEPVQVDVEDDGIRFTDLGDDDSVWIPFAKVEAAINVATGTLATSEFTTDYDMANVTIKIAHDGDLHLAVDIPEDERYMSVFIDESAFDKLIAFLTPHILVTAIDLVNGTFDEPVTATIKGETVVFVDGGDNDRVVVPFEEVGDLLAVLRDKRIADDFDYVQQDLQFVYTRHGELHLRQRGDSIFIGGESHPALEDFLLNAVHEFEMEEEDDEQHTAGEVLTMGAEIGFMLGIPAEEMAVITSRVLGELGLELPDMTDEELGHTAIAVADGANFDESLAEFRRTTKTTYGVEPGNLTAIPSHPYEDHGDLNDARNAGLEEVRLAGGFALDQSVGDESGSGVRADTGKIRTDLIPAEQIIGLARIYTYGAKKYADHNWLGGMKHSRMLGSLERHELAYKDGEDYDPESGEHHLLHVAWNALALYSYRVRGLGEDDRIPKA